jgi:hypothetical protein
VWGYPLIAYVDILPSMDMAAASREVPTGMGRTTGRPGNRNNVGL